MEIVHYFDSEKNVLIQSQARRFSITAKGKESEIKIPLPLMNRLFSKFRLLRRLLRLDKSNCYPVFSEKGNLEAVIIIYQSTVYLWDFKQLKKTYSLPGCRNVMHQAIAESIEGYLFFGEYGSNKNRDEVPIYRSIDRGKTWHEIYRFAKNTIKHVHAIQWDNYEGKLWISTGDQEGECQILLADIDFDKLEVLGDGSQRWRTCHLIFEQDYVVWGMDSPLTDCYMVKLSRKTRQTELLSKISGPVWYGRKWSDGKYLVTTSVEPGINCLDNKAKVYISDDLHNWEVLWEFDKDHFNPVYFKFGSIGFSNGNDGRSDFYMHFEAITGFDGRSVLVNKDSKF